MEKKKKVHVTQIDCQPSDNPEQNQAKDKAKQRGQS